VIPTKISIKKGTFLRTPCMLSEFSSFYDRLTCNRKVQGSLPANVNSNLVLVPWLVNA